jgi:hypothetical protein
VQVATSKTFRSKEIGLQADVKKPLKRGFSKSQEKSLLDASWVLLIFFFRAVDFFVVHFAAAMAACEGGGGHQHESGNKGSHHNFHRNTFWE